MLQVSTIINNGLSVTLGLIMYSFIVYLVYLTFFTSSSSKEEIILDDKNKEETEKEKIDNFDILEDA